MPKLLLSNSNSISSADFIIVGVPDESKSHARDPVRVRDLMYFELNIMTRNILKEVIKKFP